MMVYWAKRSTALVLAAAWSVGGAGCKSEPRPVAPRPSEVTWRHAVSGCAAWLDGPACELALPATLRVWFDATAAPRLEANGAPLPATCSAVLGGTRCAVELEAGATTLCAEDGQARSCLPIRLPRRPPIAGEALSLRQQGKLDGAEELLLRELVAAPEADHAFLRGALGRVWLSRGRSEEALGALLEASAGHLRAGRWSDAISDTLARVYTLSTALGRYAEARSALDALDAPLVTDTDGRARASYYRGLIERDVGRVRLALDHFDDARRWAQRLAMAKLESDVCQVQARLLQELGRHMEASALLEQAAALLPPDARPVARADLATNRAWVTLLARERGVDAAGDPRVPLEQALADYQAAGDVRPQAAGNVRVNLALDALERGDLDAVERWLQDASPLDPDAQAWAGEIRARTLAAGGLHAKALAAFEELARRAQATLAPDRAVRALVGQARALLALGRLREAVDTARRAEETLADRSLAIPPGAGRESFLADRMASARLLVDALLALNEPEAAFAAARQARVRAHVALTAVDDVSRLDEATRARWEEAIGKYRAARAELDAHTASAWELPADKLEAAESTWATTRERAQAALDSALSALDARRSDALPALDPSALTAMFFRLEQGWVAFAASSSGVSAAKCTPPALGTGEGEGLVACLGAKLDGTQRLRVLAAADTADIDWHAVPWRGAPLGDTINIEYALDRVAPSRAVAPTAPVVVGDPRFDLPHARAEALDVAALLPDARTLLGDEASRASVTAESARVSLLHFAGHGEWSGRGGWGSALLLAREEAWTVGDILAATSAPPLVYLSACETGRSWPSSAGLGLGLAPAFVYAGAGAVVAATRPVDDGLARAMALAFYEELLPRAKRGEAMPREAATALRLAQRKVRSERPEADWSAYRVWVP